jgi:hypothetical protein
MSAADLFDLVKLFAALIVLAAIAYALRQAFRS